MIIKKINKIFESKMPFKQYAEQKKSQSSNEIKKFRDLLLSLVDILGKIKNFKLSLSILSFDSEVNALQYFIINCSEEDLKIHAKNILFQMFIKFNIPFDEKTGGATIDALLKYIELYKDNSGNPLFTHFLPYSKTEIKKLVNKYVK